MAKKPQSSNSATDTRNDSKKAKKQAKHEARLMLKIESARDDMKKAQKKVTKAQERLDEAVTNLNELEKDLNKLRGINGYALPSGDEIVLSNTKETEEVAIDPFDTLIVSELLEELVVADPEAPKKSEDPKETQGAEASDLPDPEASTTLKEVQKDEPKTEKQKTGEDQPTNSEQQSDNQNEGLPTNTAQAPADSTEEQAPSIGTPSQTSYVSPEEPAEGRNDLTDSQPSIDSSQLVRTTSEHYEGHDEPAEGADDADGSNNEDQSATTKSSTRRSTSRRRTTTRRTTEK